MTAPSIEAGYDFVLHKMYWHGHLRVNNDYLNRAEVTVDTYDDISAPIHLGVEIIPEGEIRALGHRPQVCMPFFPHTCCVESV